MSGGYVGLNMSKALEKASDHTSPPPVESVHFSVKQNVRKKDGKEH